MTSTICGPRVTASALIAEINRHENYLALVSSLGSGSKRSRQAREQYIADLKTELQRITDADNT